MKAKTNVKKMAILAMMVALGVVLSPILRVPGMAPMQHFINVIVAVLLGPWYALACAILIALLRMWLMGVNLLAVTGAVFGAVLSGLLYRATGKMLAAVAGEIVGTGIIGAMQMFDVVMFISKGNPFGQTDVLMYRIYRDGFINFNLGMAGAESLVLGLVTIFFALGYLWLQKRSEDE